MLTQKENSLPGIQQNLYLYASCSFMDMHIHRSAEFLYVDDGEVRLTAGEREWCLQRGEAALVLPFVPHRFRCTAARMLVHVFSESLAEEFYRYLGSCVSEMPVFRPCPAAIAYYKHALQTEQTPYVEGIAVKHTVPPDAYCTISALSAVLHEFLTQVPLREQTENVFWQELMGYLEEHFREDVSLTGMAAHFGYESHYFSRLFRRTTGLGLRAMVNYLRLEEAKNLLSAGELAMTEIAMKCGFGTLRSFDRLFRATEGCAPSDWLGE